MTKSEQLALQNTILTMAIIVKEMPIDEFVAAPDGASLAMVEMAKALAAFKSKIPKNLFPAPHGPLG